MPQDNGLAKRGLLVFTVLLLLIGTVTYFFVFRRPSAPSATPLPAVEPYLSALILPSTGFPGSVDWLALSQLGGKLPSAPGWQTRYTATHVLAKRGSDKLPLVILREMLDETQQRLNHRIQLKDGKVVANEADVQEVLLIGLMSVQEWHKHPAAVSAVGKDNRELTQVYAALAKLTEHPNQVIRNEALKVRLAVQAQ